VIAAHSQKLELLKDHKKGLMQNLFPTNSITNEKTITNYESLITNEDDQFVIRNSQTRNLPKVRFKGFEKDGEWVERILSEVADYENGKAHEQDISENGKYVVVNSKFISTDGATAKYSNAAYCLAEKGDILMVLSDIPNGRAIAKCFYVNEESKYTVNQRICKIKSFDCDSLFLYYVMNRNAYFLAFDDGVKQTNLKNDDVQSFPFLAPNDPQEQQKIASCLSSLDALITAQAEKIEQLKLHKKGLMQGLFPKIV
jgi:type I restriction enzyme S subunit